MRYILRLLLLFFCLGIAQPEATAQVSVRRGGSRSESSSSAKKDKDKGKKDKDNKKDDKKNRPTSANAAASDGKTPANGSASSGTPKPVATSSADGQPIRRTSAKKDTQPVLVDGNTQRHQSFNEYQRKEEGTRPWQHVVYRELDLTQEKNASLYYPVEPQDGLTNLFRVILEGLCTGKIKGYEYLDGREVFDPKYEVKVSDILDKFQILYQQKPGVGQNAQSIYVVDEMDVPCNEVLSYFIKERWEFNQKTSQYGPVILAICPVLHRAGDFGGDAVKYPMFWVNYEDLRPLLRDHLIMSDGMNNTPRFTMEEFFTLEQYQGDIYKVQNTRGLSLMQQYPNADSLKIARERIEAQLRGFGDSIWVHEDTPAEIAARDSVKQAERAARHAERKASKGQASSKSDSKAKKNRRTKEAVDTTAIEAAQEAQEEALDERIETTGKAHSARRSRN